VTVEPTDPLDRRFPSVGGTSLARRPVRLPDDLAGAPAVLLVAYRRGTQSDIDRWARFLRAEAPATASLEVPVIPSLVWRPFAELIDGGMRGGVPSGQWSSVVTVYADGAAVREFLGDPGGLSALVVLLDAAGVVRWFHAGGFAPTAGRELLTRLRAMPTAAPSGDACASHPDGRADP
jgi:hypothetical protein